MVSFIRWYSSNQTWQNWLYRDGEFWQLSDDPFWNTDNDINEAGEVVWRSGPTTSSDVRLLRRFARGDLNCDGTANAFDIEPFIEALVSPERYGIRYPDCDVLLADMNNDGAVDGFDIQPFVERLIP